MNKKIYYFSEINTFRRNLFKRSLLCCIVLVSLATTCKTNQSNEIYYCPMHPEYTANQPGECPICHMSLVKREIHPPVADHSAYAEEIFLSDKERSELGVSLVTVEKHWFAEPVRAPGQVAYDPELYAAMVEYRQAAASMVLPENEVNTLLEPLALRLQQLGLSQSEILMLQRGSGDPATYLLRGGGNSAMVYLQVYESDIGRIAVGSVVNLRVKSYPEMKFLGKVVGISEILNSRTRSFTVRVRVQDPTRKLRSQMFVAGEILSGSRQVLAVPADAVLDTGKRKIVFLVSENGHLIPQEVETGIEQNDLVEIRSGIRESQKVAVGAAFLLDSERRIRYRTED